MDFCVPDSRLVQVIAQHNDYDSLQSICLFTRELAGVWMPKLNNSLRNPDTSLTEGLNSNHRWCLIACPNSLLIAKWFSSVLGRIIWLSRGWCITAYCITQCMPKTGADSARRKALQELKRNSATQPFGLTFHSAFHPRHAVGLDCLDLCKKRFPLRCVKLGELVPQMLQRDCGVILSVLRGNFPSRSLGQKLLDLNLLGFKRLGGTTNAHRHEDDWLNDVCSNHHAPRLSRRQVRANVWNHK